MKPPSEGPIVRAASARPSFEGKGLALAVAGNRTQWCCRLAYALRCDARACATRPECARLLERAVPSTKTIAWRSVATQHIPHAARRHSQEVGNALREEQGAVQQALRCVNVHLGEFSIHAHMDDDDSGGRSLTKDDASTSECTHTHTHTVENQCSAAACGRAAAHASGCASVRRAETRSVYWRLIAVFLRRDMRSGNGERRSNCQVDDRQLNLQTAWVVK